MRALSHTSFNHMQIIRESGWQGLFQGLKASLVGTAVSQVSCIALHAHLQATHGLYEMFSNGSEAYRGRWSTFHTLWGYHAHADILSCFRLIPIKLS